jgi:carboxyl-terminal processing protease
MKKYNIIRYIAGICIVILFSGFFEGNDIYFEINKNIDLFGKVYKEITLDYVDDINPQEFMRAGIKGMLNSLDPYTIYIDENEKEDIDLLTNGKYGGVGISIGVRGDHVTIVDVLDGYSAQRQGVRVGDVLIEAAGVKITPENVDQISQLVKGEPGTTVELRVLRNDDSDTLTFNLVREEVVVKNLAYAGFYPENSNNVYLKLTNFSRGAADELTSALRELKTKKEIKSIILDLRGNPGGLLDAAVDICDKFLPKNDLIVSTRGRDADSKKDYMSVQEPLVGNARLAVLINGSSASASEIVAGCMQDHDRGIIVGTKSFGKGLVQTITPLDYNASLKITTAKYYTPSGRCIQKIDYSLHNKVIANADSIIHKAYFTDHNRTVYGGGGITPDSTVNYKIDGGITRELLAKGIFFQFADHYYYLNEKKDFDKIKDDELFSAFIDYLNNQNFSYKSNAEKDVDDLISDAEAKHLKKSLIAGLQDIRQKYDKLDNTEYKIYKDEIIREIKSELAVRYLGNEGRIRVLLLDDPQFQTALKLISEPVLYYKILAEKN